MTGFENLTFKEMMGNLASELTRVQRVLAKSDFVAYKNYLWEALEMLEIIKQKYPNSEIYRLNEVISGMWWSGKTDQNELEAITRYTLSFYLNQPCNFHTSQKTPSNDF